MHLKNVTLELSTKPFHNDSEELLYEVCRHMFTQWKDLTNSADVVSVMLWTADGSEIFEYTGNLDQTFEWAYWCGCANKVPQRPDVTPRQRLATHNSPVKYNENAKPRPYRWLKRLVEVIRETGAEITGKPIRVGETYDNGPEFAISDFKYGRHREISQAHTIFPNSFVTCTATLNADPQPYAGFPDGIPQGTSVGTFLGKQFKALAKDIGFDYLWLSNGMGFGTETWGITGMLFDKQNFHPEKAGEAASLMLSFWNDFFNAYPGCIIETRGSNFSAGLEISTDACPLKELYREYKIAPPVNSPWAALNFNTGLELAAWMSHVAELPDERFPFRFYTHDPWFMNSPWLDRYGREPWDIFQPLSIGRIDHKGNTSMANSISFLSVDDTWGRLPDQVPREVIPHLYDAFDNGPDAPGPLVWVYPFSEYSTLVRGDNPRPDIVFTEDFYIGECLQQGTPLNTVVSTDNFMKLMEDDNHALDISILVVPASAVHDATIPAFEKHLARNGNILFYGSIDGAHPWLEALLQITRSTPITGEVNILNGLMEDECGATGLPTVAHVHPQHTCGGIIETVDADHADTVRAYAIQGGEKRVVALFRTLPGAGKVAFARCLLPAAHEISGGRNFDYASPQVTYPVPSLMRKLLAEFGWTFHCTAYTADTKLPRTCISRHDNAFFFSLYAPDTTAEMHVNTPYGAPLLTEMNTYIDENGDAVWHPERCWHKECRAFVKQHTPSVIEASIVFQENPIFNYSHRRRYAGLVDAEVRFCVPKGYKDKVEVVVFPPNTRWENVFNVQPLDNVEWEETPDGCFIIVKHVTGVLHFCVLK